VPGASGSGRGDLAPRHRRPGTSGPAGVTVKFPEGSASHRTGDAVGEVGADERVG
jgi:hypothetical protein